MPNTTIDCCLFVLTLDVYKKKFATRTEDDVGQVRSAHDTHVAFRDGWSSVM